MTLEKWKKATAERLREWRGDRTQADAARAAGVATRTWSHWEAGNPPEAWHALATLAAKLDDRTVVGLIRGWSP